MPTTQPSADTVSRVRRLSRVLPLVLLLSAPAAAEEAPPPAQRSGWIATRLTVGARFTYYGLEETRRSGPNGYDNGNLAGNFLGSLWGLDARQHYFPNPYLEYRVVSAFGMGVSYDQLRAKTLDWANDDHTLTAGDGDVEIRGVGAYLVARYRNRTRFEPYATAGYAWYKSHFDVSPGWAAPGRRFVVEDTDGWFATAGLKWSVTRHVGFDATFRHSWVGDVQGRAYLRGNHYRGGAFPMRYDALAIGVAYAF